ncbi:MAG: ribulose-phosphate 3-epimerase [Candidatus Zixiibacteriota bacterium]
MLKIAPSILAADFGRLREQVKQAEAAGADMIHLDIIDGHFAPNISFGAAVSKISVESCSLPHDAHLMVTEPENYIDDYLKLNVDYITFHLEIDGIRRDLGERRWVYVLGDRPDDARIMALIDRIKRGGAKPGLTLNPPTSIELVYPYLDKIDLLLLMSVNPGFAGQAFINNVYDKIRSVAKFRKDNSLQFAIMVDGGVGLDNAAQLHKVGADILVSGSSFFKAPDYTEFIRKIKG